MDSTWPKHEAFFPSYFSLGSITSSHGAGTRGLPYYFVFFHSPSKGDCRFPKVHAVRLDTFVSFFMAVSEPCGLVMQPGHTPKRFYLGIFHLLPLSPATFSGERDSSPLVNY